MPKYSSNADRLRKKLEEGMLTKSEEIFLKNDSQPNGVVVGWGGVVRLEPHHGLV